MAAAEREQFHVCQVKRRRVKPTGGYEAFWKVKTVVEALEDQDTEFRCKDCSGALKLFKRRAENGGTPHVEHKLKIDSEYCPSGLHFLKATDGRQPRPSQFPVR